MPLLRKADNFTIYFTFLSEFEDVWAGQTALEVLILVVLTVVAAIGNILILAATLKFKRPLRMMNILLASQCSSDLVLTSMNPFIMVTRITHDWVLGDVVCPLINYLQFATAATSVLCMTCLAVDHYLLVCHPRSKANQRLRSHAPKMVLATWLIPLIWFSPFLLVWEVVTQKQDGRVYSWCYLQWPAGVHGLAFVVSAGVFILIIPLIVITFCHSKAVLTVRRSSRKVMAFPPPPPPPSLRLQTGPATSAALTPFQQRWKQRLQIEQKLLKLLVLSVLVFVVMWLPFFAFSVLVLVIHHLTSTLYLTFLLLAFSSSCVNPVLIVYFNVQYRRHVGSILPRRIFSRSEPIETELTTAFPSTSARGDTTPSRLVAPEQ